VPGSTGFAEAAGLFGASASRLSVPASRAVSLDFADPREGILLALAATAHHALAGGALPDLIVGHGVLGRLLARIALALGGQPPTVWEAQPVRRGETAYPVIDPSSDTGAPRRCIIDASGDGALLDTLISRLAPRGEIVLAGFYTERVSFDFPAAFMREARLRVAAQWLPSDLTAVLAMVRDGRLSLSGLISHERDAREADAAYAAAFSQPECLKMILNWESFHDRFA
jgi:3-hydroxyethyl bacteriochlorophyllide a dehydrogenase